MRVMYFAKVSINSNIYDIYKDPMAKDKILNELLLAINQEKNVPIGDDAWIKFIHIEKDIEKRFIAGRIVKIYEDEIQIYDKGRDDVTPLPTKELARSVTFFFDLRSEIVAFTTAKSISKNKFINYFSALVNSYSSHAEFEVFLKHNSNILKEQIQKFSHVHNVEFTLIPPNGNKEAFDDLFAKNGAELKETGATKVQQSFSASKKGTGMNMKSALFQRVIEGVANGFGVISITGKNAKGEEYTITSEKEAPQKRFIPDNDKDSIPAIKEHGKEGIIQILANEHSMKG